jgi:hypothetical protein
LRGRAWEGAARLSAFHHGTCGSDRTPPLSFSHATSGDLVGARAPMVRKTRASQRFRPGRSGPLTSPRALPAPSCPRPARLHPQSGHDAGRACPAEAARGAQVTSPCPREPHPLRHPVSPADDPARERERRF